MKFSVSSQRSTSHPLLLCILAVFALFATADAATLPALKTLKTTSGYKYGYVYKKAVGTKPTYLLLHGFPSSVFDWKYQIAELTAAGYGVLAPDLLGYGGTDKPAAIEEYVYSKMAKQVKEILDKEGLTQVIGVGHDWGSMFLGRFANFYPTLFPSLVFISVPYLPSQFSVEDINTQTEAAFGYPTFGYMLTMNESRAAGIFEKHPESFLSIMYPQNSSIWITDFCPLGKLRAWVESDKRVALPSYESTADRAYRVALYKAGGFTGPTNWYKSYLRDLDAVANAAIPAGNLILKQPVLFIGGSVDYITRPEVMQQIAGQGQAEGWAPTVEVNILEGGSHWVVLEKHKEVTDLLISRAT
ncbi:uncharacterized protein N0V89_005299 [Didymosphaeria variabile]|uniref:AB hydrolase-1 domain-containing protein n=1 Tax=Didymosphaeria variabile TaxID=1932322 RepID=A0A9W8XL79_9PLEO|nr:uncharacterized protein N0V89_005299 [Didymosphaeria variabile]KAJ4353569.1 hypothetical protein N0V89_005299 [Didymosphaeria variabile]